MPATVKQVRDGLEVRLKTIAGLNAASYLPEQINTPVGFPVLASIDYRGAFRGGNVQMVFAVHVIVGRYQDKDAHDALSDYLAYDGAKSIRAALDGDQTLGGVCQGLILESSTDISTVSVAAGDYLQLQCLVTVHA